MTLATVSKIGKAAVMGKCGVHFKAVPAHKRQGTAHTKEARTGQPEGSQSDPVNVDKVAHSECTSRYPCSRRLPGISLSIARYEWGF